MIDVDIEKTFPARHGEAHTASIRVAAQFRSDARIIALFGKSGSGKSTIVNAIAGLVMPDRGRIAIDGEVLFDRAAELNCRIESRGIGYVFQEGLLFPHLTVKQNLLYGANRTRAGTRAVPFEQVTELLGIDALLSRAAPTLSGGEKQRVAIGRALLSNPRLLLMDEPLASLDAARRAEILRLIERVRDELSVRIVYVSHSIGEVTRLADDVAILNEGRVVACDRTESIFNRTDLRPFTGRYEGGALIEATATAHDHEYFLTRFAFDGGHVVAPGLEVPIGMRVRLRIRARDVTLATERPRGISVRNVLNGSIVSMDDRGGAIVEVIVRIGSREMPSRISRQARDEMQLKAGQEVFLLVKAIAFDKRSMGYTT